MKVQLKNVKINEDFSEETTCFVADVFINGKKAAYAKNDGHGGSTFYYAYEEYRDLVRTTERFFTSLPPIVKHDEQFGILKYKQSLEDVIDDLLEEHLKKQGEKKMLKEYEKAICVGIPNGYTYRTFVFRKKNKTIIKLKAVSKDSLRRDLINIKRFHLKEGEVILNTNLEALGIVL